jgi:hypothetical protein
MGGGFSGKRIAQIFKSSGTGTIPINREIIFYSIIKSLKTWSFLK